MCGLKQGSQRAGLPDVSYYPAPLTRPSSSPFSPFLTSQMKKEGQKLTKLFPKQFYCIGLTIKWVSAVKKNPTAFKIINPHLYGFEGKSLMSTGYDTTNHIPVPHSLHFGQHGRENPVAWIKSTQCFPRRKSPLIYSAKKWSNQTQTREFVAKKAWKEQLSP